MNAVLPWLHPQRADVLAALALVVRRRQPLAPAFARLAAGDPLLQPWNRRLAAGLAAGDPLGAVLRRHRLLDRRAAAQLDAAADPVAAFERVAGESLLPVRGLVLVRWFPAALVVAILLPVMLVHLSGVSAMYEAIYKDLNIKLPMLTSLMLGRSWASALAPLSGGLLAAALLSMLGLLRGLRHLRHLWWVEVHRQAALLRLADAAVAGDDAPRHLAWPASWLAALRLSAWRQDRPGWDHAWRTWRILTRWRILDPGWRAAARAHCESLQLMRT